MYVSTPSFGLVVRKLHPFENNIIVVYYNIIINKMSVKNISSLRYFLDRWETVDHEYNYTVPYHENIDSHFVSLPTFVAEFYDCKVHTCPLLVTREKKLITDHVWKLTHKSRHKPYKSHYAAQISIAFFVAGINIESKLRSLGSLLLANNYRRS